jgi:rod shape-determining protein MreC
VAFRDGPFENLKVPLAWTAAVAVIVALIASLFLIVSDRREVRDHDNYTPVRAGFDSVAGPVNGVLAAPVRWTGALSDGIKGYFFAVSENRRLRAQVADLQPWRDQAIALKNVNARYEAMLGLRTEPAVAMVTARSVSDARGPFVNARLIDAGSSKGVRIGNPVINEHGMVGRIIGTTGGISRVLLLTDVSSRTPILIDRTDARAMLTGDGSGNPRLEFLRSRDLQAGDRVLSSGDGGGIPRGVPIGVAAKGIDGSWRVKLFSDRGAIDYVRVMLFQDFGQLVNPEALNAAPLAGLGTAPSPGSAQAAAIGDASARRAAAAASAVERARAASATPPAATSPAAIAAAPRPTAPRPVAPRPTQAAPGATPTGVPAPTQPGGAL